VGENCIVQGDTNDINNPETIPGVHYDLKIPKFLYDKIGQHYQQVYLDGVLNLDFNYFKSFVN
jgi:hypothetical protein